jgi:predicted amidohydrolase
MTRVLGFLLLSASVAAGAEPISWALWSPRPDNAPKLIRSGDELRILSGGNRAVYGGWQGSMPVAAGRWYEFTGQYRADGVQAENWQVVARVDWIRADGKRAGQPDYFPWSRQQAGWRQVTGRAPAPEGAVQANVQLLLAAAPDGDVKWRGVSFTETAAPAPRRVQVASVNLRPDRTASAAESVERFAALIDAAVPPGTDVILLPEGITVVGTGKTYAEVAESVPGPSTERLGQLARKHKAWLAAGIYEREGKVLYNTSVLLDREGRVAGKYRKVYLPREELERGLTPGNEYPVFQTDFGTVGMMICYDVFFPDPARALAVQGADLILMPIWGGDETLAKARAIENKVFLAASGYDHPTYVMDPDGQRLSEAKSQGSVAVSVIDLGRRYLDPWLGEMRTRRLRELRVDVPTPLPGRRD